MRQLSIRQSGRLSSIGSGIRLKGRPGTVHRKLMYLGFLSQQKHIPIHIIELKHAAIRQFSWYLRSHFQPFLVSTHLLLQTHDKTHPFCPEIPGFLLVLHIQCYFLNRVNHDTPFLISAFSFTINNARQTSFSFDTRKKRKNSSSPG